MKVLRLEKYQKIMTLWIWWSLMCKNNKRNIGISSYIWLDWDSLKELYNKQKTESCTSINLTRCLVTCCTFVEEMGFFNKLWKEKKCQNSYMSFMMDFVEGVLLYKLLQKNSWLDDIIGPYCWKIRIIIARNVRYVKHMQISWWLVESCIQFLHLDNLKNGILT
jgi:hypothetical protein